MALSRKEISKRYRIKHHEECKVKNRKWYYDNLEHARTLARANMKKRREEGKIRRYPEDAYCLVCGENRVLDNCHIIPKAISGSDESWNRMFLCPNHHRLFDNGGFNEQEINKIKYRVEHAINQFGNKKFKVTMAAKILNKSAGVWVVSNSTS